MLLKKTTRREEVLEVMREVFSKFQNKMRETLQQTMADALQTMFANQQPRFHQQRSTPMFQDEDTEDANPFAPLRDTTPRHRPMGALIAQGGDNRIWETAKQVLSWTYRIFMDALSQRTY